MKQAVKPQVSIAMIAAVADNGVIGVNNALPWRIPADLKYFKRLTLGKKIIMGRKTFESIGSPLPGRKNIVITRNVDWQCASQDVDIVHSVEDALARAVNLSLRDNNSEVMVIGGEQVYRDVLNRADRLYITRVFTKVEGDATFPAIDEHQWREVGRQEHGDPTSDQLACAFTVLDRVTSQTAGNHW